MTMTPCQFTDRALATPWVRWGDSWDGCDCFGLVVMWHRHVIGIELGHVPHTDIESGFLSARNWERCEIESGATCFMAFLNGAASHCGVVLDSLQLIHAQGSSDRGGRVKVSPMAAIQRLYGDIKFYRYKPTC